MLRLADPTLLVLVGPSASGKSTWAAQHFAPEQIISSDRMRALVGESQHDLSASADAFAVVDQVVAARMRRRLTTVVDTLGLDGDRRRTWREIARHNDVPCVAVAFDTPAAVCRQWNAARVHRVPAAVLSGQIRAYAEVRESLADEGFADVIAPDPVRVVAPSIAAAARSVPPADRKRDTALRFGLHMSSFEMADGSVAIGDRVRTVAAEAEAAGFSSLWVMDHFRQVPQLGRPWENMLESATTLGHLAAATGETSVGCLVHGVTYRNVAHLGKIVATLDVLSGGRAWCGLGAAWYEAEHAAYGWPFPPVAERFELLEDALQLFPLLWGPGTPSFEGRRVQVPEAMCYPRPLRGRIPILVGGSGERRTLRLAARYADACNLFGDAERVRHKVDVLRSHCRDLGRDPAEVEVTHLSTVLVAADPDELGREVQRLQPARGGQAWRRRTNPGTVEDHVLRVRALEAAGVEHVIVNVTGLWDSPALERFADVIAAFR